MGALLNFAPTSQILFGSDYPFIAVEKTTSALAAYPLPSEVRASIASGNARPLFPRLSP